MNIFLAKLDEKYYDELRPKHSVDELCEARRVVGSVSEGVGK